MDRIEKQIRLKAPRAQVWRALTDADQFGRWFGANLTGKTFKEGERTSGPITIEGYRHVMFDVIVERIDPERLFSWRWHPAAIEAAVDYSKEPRTLVVFELQDAGDGTLLKVTESGFEGIPVSRRADALRMNTGGWEGQLQNIENFTRRK